MLKTGGLSSEVGIKFPLRQSIGSKDIRAQRQLLYAETTA